MDCKNTENSAERKVLVRIAARAMGDAVSQEQEGAIEVIYKSEIPNLTSLTSSIREGGRHYL